MSSQVSQMHFSPCFLGRGTVSYVDSLTLNYCGAEDLIMVRKYRLVLIFKSDLKKDAKEKLVGQIKTWSGKISNDKITELGEKKFAYPVRGNQKGDYVLFSFESPAVSTELEEKVRIHDDILRHLLVRD